MSGKREINKKIKAKEDIKDIRESIKTEIIDSFEDTDTKRNYSELKKQINLIKYLYGIQEAINTLRYLRTSLKLNKPSLAIYDHTFHLIGGGQKYGLTIADALKDIFDITIIANKTITHENILNWYNLQLSNCKIKIIPIPLFEEMKSTHLDPNRISKRMENPFHIISKESGNYDIFVNNSMNEMVLPLSNISVIICHFPERRPVSYFYSDKYTYTVFNSKYTAEWIEKRWKYKPHKHIYPPVDMKPLNNNIKKENIILSVARFEESGSKKQLEMIKAFKKLRNLYPEKLKNWRLILVGGSPESNPYLDRILSLLDKKDHSNIQIHTNISEKKLKNFYEKSKVFWHLCGLNQIDPALVEHFGMTIVEAMQNKLVPMVFNGGGQKEIVIHKESGYLINTISELIQYTFHLIDNKQEYLKMSENAFIRSELFGRDGFEQTVIDFFSKISDDYYFN